MSDDPLGTDKRMIRRKADNPTPNESYFQHGKVPPQAIDLEEAVLGAMMIEKDALEEIIHLLHPQVFYKEANQVIFKSVKRLYGKRNPVDILTVTDDLRKSGELEIAGGPYYITMLTQRVASGANVDFHAHIILQKFIQREIIRVSSDSIKDSYEDTTDVFALLDTVEKNFTDLRNISIIGGNMKHISEIGIKAEEELRKREQMSKEGKCTGIRTPLKDLTQVLRGWQPSDLILLASRPGRGKTSLLLISAKVAAEQGIPVCLYELEMSDISLYNKLILSDCDISYNNFMSGYMSEYDWIQFHDAQYRLAKLPIYVDDNPMVTMDYILSHSTMMKKKELCGMIGIDYLQLADMDDERKNRNREQEVSKASRLAKIIAKKLDIPVLLLSQLSREVEKRGGTRKPILSDLRESGAIEQDADIVIFISRPWMDEIKEDDKGNTTENMGILSIAKHRMGKCRDVLFGHNDSLTKIWDYDPNDPLGQNIPPEINEPTDQPF